MQVNFFPEIIAVFPSLGHPAPGFTAAVAKGMRVMKIALTSNNGKTLLRFI
jgi:hypothetical protein